MRFLHTADWHLGRTLNGIPLLEDQAHALDQLVDAAAQADLDAIVLAGDVFDLAVPSPRAIELFDDLVHRLVVGCGLPMLVIAGNHDDPVRLAAHARLLGDKGLHIAGPLARPVTCVDIASRQGTVTRFHLLPFADPAFVRSTYGSEARDHAAAMAATLEHLDGDNKVARHVGVGHAFVSGGSESESERLISVGQAGCVPAGGYFSCTPAMDYVALGHLHRPQTVGRDAVRYSGSPLKYSQSEAGDDKGFGIVDLTSEAVAYEHVAITPQREVREIVATLEAVQAMEPSEDLVFVTLTDDVPVLGAMAKVRAVFPNAVQVRREATRPTVRRLATKPVETQETEADVVDTLPEVTEPPQRFDVKQLSDVELFTRFVREVADRELTDDQRMTFAEAAAKVRAEELGHATEEDA